MAATPRAVVQTSSDIWLALRDLNAETGQCLFSLAWASIKVLIKESSEMLSAGLPRVSVQGVFSWGYKLVMVWPTPEVMGAFWGERGVAEHKATGMDYSQKDPITATVYMEVQTLRNNHCPQGCHCLLCTSSFCQQLLLWLPALLFAKSPDSSHGSSFFQRQSMGSPFTLSNEDHLSNAPCHSWPQLYCYLATTVSY